jgi:hypothetical protein
VGTLSYNTLQIAHIIVYKANNIWIDAQRSQFNIYFVSILTFPGSEPLLSDDGILDLWGIGELWMVDDGLGRDPG